MNSTVESYAYEMIGENTSEHIMQQRYQYLDNLRALAMIAGVFFHVSLVYSLMLHNLW